MDTEQDNSEFERILQQTMAERGETRDQVIAGVKEYSDMVAREFARRWLAGEAPQFMYEPPFYRGMAFTNRNTGEDVRVESEDARGDFGIPTP